MLDEPPLLTAVWIGYGQLGLGGAVHIQLAVFIDVAVGVAGDGNGFLEHQGGSDKGGGRRGG